MLDKSPARGAAARTADQMHHQARTLRIWALLILVPVAVIGAALSFQSLYRAAAPVFGQRLALGFPLLVDFLILGASLQYVAGAKTGRPRAGWRWTAHAGVAGTLALNAMAARTLHDVPWHITAPAVWSVLVELTAREVLGQWRAAHAPLGDQIPLRLWFTAPIESARTWLRMARRVDGEQAQARLDVGVHAAAVEALKLALPQRNARTARRIIQRQLRAGSLPPAAVLGPLGWLNADDALTEITPQNVLRAALRDTLVGQQATTQTAPDTQAQLRPNPPTPPAGPPPEPPTQPTGERGTAITRPVTHEPQPDLAPPPDDQPQTSVDLRALDAPDNTGPSLAAPIADETDTKNAGGDVTGPIISTGDRFADAVDVVRVHETISAAQLATQLRSLGWHLSDRTASRILTEVRDHLQQNDPWALPLP